MRRRHIAPPGTLTRRRTPTAGRASPSGTAGSAAARGWRPGRQGGGDQRGLEAPSGRHLREQRLLDRGRLPRSRVEGPGLDEGEREPEGGYAAAEGRQPGTPA